MPEPRVGSAAARFFRFSVLTGLSPALQLLVGLLLMVGFVLLWGVLLFRKAALILVAVFAPIAFAGSAWDQTRVWTRRWLEIVAALVFCKVVIVVTFVVGASAFSGAGPAVGSVPAGGDSTGLSDLLVGVLLLVQLGGVHPGGVHPHGQGSASLLDGLEAALGAVVAASPAAGGDRGQDQRAGHGQHAGASAVSAGSVGCVRADRADLGCHEQLHYVVGRPVRRWDAGRDMSHSWRGRQTGGNSAL